MAKTRRKRPRLVCKKKGCRFSATGPTTLGKHYRQHPSHSTAKSVSNRESERLDPPSRRKGAFNIPTTARTAQRPKPRLASPVAITYECPHCGGHIRVKEE